MHTAEIVSTIPTVRQAQLAGKTVLIRVDFNVPLDDQQRITDDRRMRASLPTLQYILDQGAALVIMTHLGRPKNGPEDKYSTRHLQDHLAELLGRSVIFVSDCLGDDAQYVCSHLQPGDVVLLENVRFHNDTGKDNAPVAERLSTLGQVYVNDAFGTAHRAHASTATIANYFKEKYAGLLMAAEVENAERVLNNIRRPYLAIVGGAKVSDKINVIENLLDRVDTLLIGGGMTYTFLKAQGLNIGKSLCEDDKLDLAKSLIEKAAAKGVKLLLPVDSVVADDFKADANTQVVGNDQIPDGWMGLDIGPRSIANAQAAIAEAQTILWNGPMGVFEMDAFNKGTFAVADAVAKATQAGAYSLVGGGDSAAAVEQAGLQDQISYVSTGGGALLEYLEGKVLPGIKALQA